MTAERVDVAPGWPPFDQLLGQEQRLKQQQQQQQQQQGREDLQLGGS